jgi:hypothetical protein
VHGGNLVTGEFSHLKHSRRVVDGSSWLCVRHIKQQVGVARLAWRAPAREIPVGEFLAGCGQQAGLGEDVLVVQAHRFVPAVDLGRVRVGPP